MVENRPFAQFMAYLTLVIGVIVARTGSFFYALAYIGFIAMIGALSYVFVVGDVHRVEMTDVD